MRKPNTSRSWQAQFPKRIILDHGYHSFPEFPTAWVTFEVIHCKAKPHLPCQTRLAWVPPPSLGWFESAPCKCGKQKVTVAAPNKTTGSWWSWLNIQLCATIMALFRPPQNIHIGDGSFGEFGCVPVYPFWPCPTSDTYGEVHQVGKNGKSNDSEPLCIKCLIKMIQHISSSNIRHLGIKGKLLFLGLLQLQWSQCLRTTRWLGTVASLFQPTDLRGQLF